MVLEPRIEPDVISLSRQDRKLRSIFKRAGLRLAAQLAVLRGRSQSRQRVRQLQCRRLLVLCYGNIYRSPLVAELMRSGFRENQGIEVRSAGFHPKGGRPIRADYAARMGSRIALGLAEHRSKVVTPEDFEWSDTIVVMDRHNWHSVARVAPDQLEKIVWLGAFSTSGPVEIKDPYGRTEAEVDEIIALIFSAVPEFVSQINSVRNRLRAI